MIEVLENNHGKRKITCYHCNSVLRYEHEDVQTKYEEYEIYHHIYDTKAINYIICPVCHKEINFNF